MNAALLIDLYQLTMARSYFERGIADRRATFHLTFRSPPFGGSYAIAAGIDAAIDHVSTLRFEPSDLVYLSLLRGRGGPLLGERLLEALAAFRFACDVHAVREGTVVFPHEPLLRVDGPLWQAQLVETALLTFVGFPTLVATKASRVTRAAAGRAVIEFGARRAQGWQAALEASRAAFIGGCEATSNLHAGLEASIPVSGTHAHSFVLAFDDEPAAFAAYADAYPDDATLLVDTYDTHRGVTHAIEVARALRSRNKTLGGIRLDSGDLLALSIHARRALNDAGFPDVKIVASSDLDEHAIADLVARGAPIDVFGVGTKLVTAYDQPSLGCVYKLAALDGTPRMKLSDTPGKQSMPGAQQALRIFDGARIARDHIAHVDEPVGDRVPLLSPALERGEPVRAPSSPSEARIRARADLDALDPAITRLEAPQRFPVAFSARLREDRQRLVTALERSET